MATAYQVIENNPYDLTDNRLCGTDNKTYRNVRFLREAIDGNSHLGLHKIGPCYSSWVEES
eukprot:Pgem_evm1s12123